MVADGSLELCYDARILAEYREVLLRPRFGFDRDPVEALLDQIRELGTVVAPHPLPAPLPDPDDEPFLEVALVGGAESLVTGNLRHYPAKKRHGTRVETPAQFVERIRRAR